jgi:hypothetical protein
MLPTLQPKTNIRLWERNMKTIARPKIAFYFLIVSLIVANLITGCNPLTGFSLNGPTPTPQPPLSPWVNQLLTNPTCIPPCWEKIIPGETSYDDALEIIKKHPDFKLISAESSDTKSPESRTDTLNIEFEPIAPIESPGSGLIRGYISDKMVYTISLRPGYTSVDLPLSDFIKKYGVPEIVIGKFCDPLHCYSHVVYPQLGLTLEVQTGTKKGEIGKIEPNSPVKDVIFFPKGIEGYKETSSLFGVPKLKPMASWNGYGQYPFKP